MYVCGSPQLTLMDVYLLNWKEKKKEKTNFTSKSSMIYQDRNLNRVYSI